ncbi:MAG TPA: hypothetical protein VMY78_07825 [Solirubrobacteraceae bacterium]|nr:hypothetical protein [Solirubrobacteraceae bacterium]
MKLILPGLALALALVPTAMAAKPPAKPAKPKPNGASAVTIAAKPSIIVFSGATTLGGRLSGAASSGIAVGLEQDDSRPYGDSYKPSNATTTTANNGAYAFTVKPLRNTQYRVVARTSPPVTSPASLVRVRIRVGANVSDTTPARGSLVRFSGSAFPAHDGRIVSIQKRSSSGGFITVSRTTLRDAGDAKSTYSRRLRVFRDGVYRVKIAGDGDHISGYSRLRALTVHG